MRRSLNGLATERSVAARRALLEHDLRECGPLLELSPAERDRIRQRAEVLERLIAYCAARPRSPLRSVRREFVASLRQAGGEWRIPAARQLEGWLKRYLSRGAAGLIDGRGRHCKQPSQVADAGLVREFLARLAHGASAPAADRAVRWRAEQSGKPWVSPRVADLIAAAARMVGAVERRRRSA